MFALEADLGLVADRVRRTSNGTQGSAESPPVSPYPYRGTSLIRNTPLLGPYSRTRVLWWSKGGGLFLMSEVPL